MLPAVLALLSSLTYGAADFLGGLASRRASTIAVVIVSQAAGLLLVGMALPLLPSAHPSVADLMWGGAAGLTGGIGVALLYRGLAIGPMSIVAPVTAVCAVMVPVAAGIASGEALSTLTGAGIVLAAASIVLVGQSANPESIEPIQPIEPIDRAKSIQRVERATPLRALPIALASGVVIGLFLVTLEQTAAEAGMWPLVSARVVSISLFGMAALVRTERQVLSRRGAAIAVAGGSIDMLANALYLVAVRQGPLSVIATLTSLYPASTVLLARLVLGERLSRYQKVGVAGAVVAAVMIVGGAV